MAVTDKKSTELEAAAALKGNIDPRQVKSGNNEQQPDYLRLILTSRVYDIVKETPLQEAINLNNKLNTKIFLKREDLQPVFSFKIRGAYNKMANLTAKEKACGVIACSAGNHAQGVAMAAKHLGIKAKIVMPASCPPIKWRNVKRLGAEVILHGNDFDTAKQECVRLIEEEGLTNIPPYDDPYVIAGQGTIGMEILRQHDINDIAAIYIQVGGGGLIAGIASYVKRIAPHIKIIAVEADDANAMTFSLNKKERVELNEVGLFADGAAVRVVGEETFRVAQSLIDEMVNVTNDEVCAAIKDVFEDTRSICEPTGALALAGAKKYLQLNPHETTTGKAHVAIVSGANVNFDRLRFISERAELGEQTEAFCTVKIPERPGSFMKMIEHVLPRNVTEFTYRYSDLKDAHVYISFKVDHLAQEVEQVLKAWAADGLKGCDVSHNELAKAHARYMVGGRGRPDHERVFRFVFPERPGALMKFLKGMNSTWNVSLFNYRNHGDDMGKVFVGIQVPPEDYAAFDEFLNQLGYHYEEETDNVVYKTFLLQ
ncbi:threonine ammonia-lyase, biosynthetic [Zychaea mexicana]|uniref:threonine ammonia-lyase, biosynthetic n=1 Tax=Zychaea mexicana TaxID=64656 RepID=UPI0022FDC4A6|nr:threonine ammonia-lyase, biosynthetic [Zychaea mexicana]KAI9498875.1 threonine ammonia-lyase, biosynthetic [Zychaea mexicana]